MFRFDSSDRDLLVLMVSMFDAWQICMLVQIGIVFFFVVFKVNEMDHLAMLFFFFLFI